MLTVALGKASVGAETTRKTLLLRASGLRTKLGSPIDIYVVTSYKIK